MSDSQIVKRLTPQIRVSSLDSHRMLTPPAPQAKPAARATRPPRKTAGAGGQPLKPGTADVVFKRPPIDAVMQSGGAVVIKRPEARGPRLAVEIPAVGTISDADVDIDASPDAKRK